MSTSPTTPSPRGAAERLANLMSERIVVIDGGMGTLIQAARLGESDYRGERYREHPSPLMGANDLLCLTRPDVIVDIHRQYFAAGADIVETNSFNANRISLMDYGLQDEVYAINVAAAQLGRQAADEVSASEPGRLALVAGSMGPTTRTASLSPDVNDPAYRAVTFDDLRDAYYEQARGLLDGGADLLLAETSFDTLNLKAALFAVEQLFEDRGERVPLIASVTITDRSGRTLSGQTVEAFWLSIEHVGLTAVAMNCALGASQMRPHLEELSRVAPLPVLCYPNAGLPNEMGEYDESPGAMAATIAEFAAAGLLNMTGGCCGTSPDHIRAIVAAVRPYAPRVAPAPSAEPRWSGLEAYRIYEGSTFTMVGERTNVAGSRRFRNLIRADDFEGATRVARKQVEGGANVIDVNMDEGLLDSPAVMTRFLNQVAAEPDIARVPVMVDSSRFEVIEAGLKCLQGKSIVNSLSLKEGEADFLEKARLVRRYGASVVVMAFDEQGQATSTARRVAICERAYRLLTEQAGFAPHDIIFDPNILAIGTGIEEHDDYGLTFLEATSLIKQRCPGALISGGVSNLSFSFRGNGPLREAIHAVFLYHAIAAGMDMGIVNAGQLEVYDEVPPNLLEAAEDLVLARRADATERLVVLGESLGGRKKARDQTGQWRSLPLAGRIEHALLRGNSDYIEADMAEALASGDYPSPLAIIEGPLMAGMAVVGDLFGAGKMFLPQVVKSARVMKKGVAWLEPYMDDSVAAAKAGLVIMATVKGDVHDIGKNIVGVVLRCNGYEVIDLGVMVPGDRILDEAVERQADIVGLSGLITPSLDEMVHVAAEMERRNLAIPLLIGGATTSKKHTAVRIAPAYSHTTLHVNDASRAVGAVGSMLKAGAWEAADAANRVDQARLRERFEARRAGVELLSLQAARDRGLQTDWDAVSLPRPGFLGVRTIDDVSVVDLVELIDWGPFFLAWELKASWKKQLEDPEVGAQYRELFDDARRLLDELSSQGTDGLHLRGVYGFFEARSEGDDIVVLAGERAHAFPMLRQQAARIGKRTPMGCLADLIAPAEAGQKDHLAAFAVTAGGNMAPHLERFAADHDDYSSILLKAVADRLAEAFAEHTHRRIRHEWGFGAREGLGIDDLHRERYRGIRPAYGYPACPDHTEKARLWTLLQPEERAGMTLTEHFAMLPAASVSGLVFAHPEARYFAVGRIGSDQVADYAARKGMEIAEVERWLGPNLR